MQFTTELIARLPRCRCPEHGVKTIVPQWAGKHSRFTLLFEAFTVEVLQACRTVKTAADLLGLAWDAVQTIMDRAVARGLKRQKAAPVKHVGIDAKNFGRGQDYIAVLKDIDGSRVLVVTPEPTRAAAEAALDTLTVEQRQTVCAVVAAMLPAHANAAAATMPSTELVHDKFHVAKHLGGAVDQVRREENTALQPRDDNRLKATRQLWLFNESSLSPEQRRCFDAIKKHGLKTARTWEISDLFRKFCRHVYSITADRFFTRWCAWAVRCRLRPMVRVAKMLNRHLPTLLTCLSYPITNATTKGFNTVMQALKYAARGFRSFDNYQTLMLFFY